MKNRTKMICLYALAIFLIACGQNDKEITSQLVGDWSFVGKKEPLDEKEIRKLPPPYMFKLHNTGFILHKNGICEHKVAQSDLIPKGVFTHYVVKNKVLKIWDKAKEQWNSYKVLFINQNTLELMYDHDIVVKYTKEKHDTTSIKHYDQIIVSSFKYKNGFPIEFISISQDGTMWFYAKDDDNYKQGRLFVAHIPREVYADIEKRFEHAKADELQDDYADSQSHGEWHCITFVRAGKIVKTISDYARTAPIKLFWAYSAVRELPYRFSYKPVSTDLPIKPALFFGFETDTKISQLMISEFFYLLMELQKSKEVIQKFSYTYYLTLWDKNGEKMKIYTDGRYYLIKNKTYDLGYNFFITHKLDKKTRDKTHYELK